MDWMHSFLSSPVEFVKIYALPFVVVLSLLVFIHEWGHYIVARLCGVRVETFSIGFGPEIWGRTDRAGTRWKFSWLPLGGYVQMLGDTDPSSARARKDDSVRPLTDEEKKVAFYTRPVGQRAAIVFAGPAVNFIFAFLLLAGLFLAQGEPFTPPVAGAVVAGSPADKAGIRPGDKILSMNGRPMQRFQDMVLATAINLDREMTLTLARASGKGQWSDPPVTVRVTPQRVTETDRFGFRSERGRLGIAAPKHLLETRPHTLSSAVLAAGAEIWRITSNTLQALWQMVAGTRSAEELGGVLRIGAYIGDFAERGVVALALFAAFLSVNLGLVNLLPIPMLDGGHLAFYAMEKINGKPLNERLQEYALRTGMAFLLAIMLFATWNDLVQMRAIDYLKALVS